MASTTESDTFLSTKTSDDDGPYLAKTQSLRAIDEKPFESWPQQELDDALT